MSPLDAQERDRLVLENLSEVSYIARRIRNRVPEHIAFEDLMDSGVVGLLEAINHYDPKRHTKLITFARLRIEGAILDSLRDLDWGPRELRKKGRQLEEALHRLRSRMGRAPLEEEIAAEMGLSPESLGDLLCELRGLELGSLEEMRAQNPGSERNCHLIPSRDQDPLGLYLQAELRAILARALAELSERDREVIALYYVEELTMKQVGAVLGVGEGRVSQIHAAALLRLRSLLQEMLDIQTSDSSEGPAQPATPDAEWNDLGPTLQPAA